MNREQQAAFDGIDALYDGQRAAAALLQGVTGSGKTAIYVHLIDRMLRRGKSSILLVPEIALTPQMIRIFSSYFGENVAVLHSSLAVGERYDEWKRVRAGRARVVIGTRSAVFAPCPDLGLVIIDEEQEYTYKSENSPRYHARDVAKYRAAHNGGLLVLGSATPDLESRYWAEQGRYRFFRLSNRFNARALPSVEIVDMRAELRAGNGTALSRALVDAIRENLSRGEQSILFLNRRGTSSLIACGECGFTYTCPNCSVHLTWHGSRRRLMCHHCGFTRMLDDRCPECGGLLDHYLSRAEMILGSIVDRGAEWNFLMGTLSFRRGWMDEASRYFRIAATMDPGNAEYRQAVAYMENNSRKPYTTTTITRSDPDVCNICSSLLIADCCCEMMGGDLIRCC